MIDTHHHLLPRIDDGAKSIEMSLRMVEVAIESGVTDIVVTPHHGNGAFDNFKKDIIDRTSQLKKIFDEQNIQIKLHLGSELHFTPEVIPQLKANKVLTYADQGKAILLELPKQRMPLGLDIAAREFQALGVQPVIAHPERNSELARTPEKLTELHELGYKAQLTALSVTGAFGKPIKKVSDRWISEGLIYTVASDAHRPHGRSPKLIDAYNEVLQVHGAQAAELLFLTNPRHLIEGTQLERLVINMNSKQSLFTRLLSRIS